MVKNINPSSKNRMNKILTAPDKDVTKTSGANGVLSRLARQMLNDLNISPPRFGSLMQDYILDPRNGVPDNKKDQTSHRGNLTKEFARPQMTWKVFFKFLRFLQIRKLKFSVEATHFNNRTTVHSTSVSLGDYHLDDQPEELEAVPFSQALDSESE